MLKKRDNGSRAPGCTNRAEENSDITRLVMIIIIENSSIVGTVYSGIFRDIYGHSAIFSYV